MSNTRNNSIDIFRLVCAILVVAIHTEPFYDVSENVGMVMTMVLPRIAVPFFFVVAGFFYVKKLNTGKSPFIPYLLRTIMVYFIWSIPYWVIDLVNGVNSEGFYFVSFAKGCVFNFLFFWKLLSFLVFSRAYSIGNGNNFVLQN